MEVKFVEKKKDVVELEFIEKDVPVALVGALLRNDVDAYWYEPHPLKKAVTNLASDWSTFKKALEAKLK